MTAKNAKARKGLSLAQPSRPRERIKPSPTPGVERLTYSIDEAAEILGVSRAVAYLYASDGTLPTIRFGKQGRGRVLVPKAALERLLASV